MQIDLSTLPPPEVIETLSFEAILDEMRADLVARFPQIEPTLALESTIVSKVLQVAAFREVLLRARINDAAVSLLLARAGGANLDNLAANFGVTRLVVAQATNSAPALLEDDDRLRRRVVLAIEAYSVAGPSGAYIYHALSAAPELRDASAISVEPGVVTVTLMKSLSDPAPTADQRERVVKALSDETVRPLTDVLIVAAPEILGTDITAELMIYPGPDGNVIADRARARLADFIGEAGFLGRDLRRSAIFSRLHVEGVQSVSLSEPAADIIGSPRRAIRVGAINLSIIGG
jgi:phage-related baseplate assembly protein